MKLSTKIMAGAFLAGLAATIIVVASGVSGSGNKAFHTTIIQTSGIHSEENEIGGETVTKPIAGRFVSVDFTELRPEKRFKINNFKGYAVLESDTARRAWIKAPADWMKVMRIDEKKGILTVETDIKNLTESYGLYFNSKPYIAATVIVPRGTLQSATTGTRTLYLDSVIAKSFTAVSADRITLNGSSIDTLNCPGRRLSELKLDGSVVGTALVKKVSSNFRVTCADDKSYLHLLRVGGVDKGNEVNLNFEKANLGRVWWNREDSLTHVILKSVKKIDFIRH